MTTTMDTLFGPLGPQYCMYFFYLSVFGFALMIMAVVSSLYIGISKKLGAKYYISMIFVSLTYFIFYFQNRLLYTMCAK
jgi:hypothetical protein